MDATGFHQRTRRSIQRLSLPSGSNRLVDGSLVRSFETNEAIAYQGAEATHFGVVLSGTVAAFSGEQTARGNRSGLVEGRRYIRRSSA